MRSGNCFQMRIDSPTKSVDIWRRRDISVLRKKDRLYVSIGMTLWKSCRQVLLISLPTNWKYHAETAVFSF